MALAVRQELAPNAGCPTLRFSGWSFCFFHRFPQFFQICGFCIPVTFTGPPLPQTLSLGQLEPHFVNPPTPIRITNKLFLTIINHRPTTSFHISTPSPLLSPLPP